MSESLQTEKNVEPKPFYSRMRTSITKLFYQVYRLYTGFEGNTYVILC